MKRTVKKGFTIVELVIVIAVVAILAAVLIPTFASLIKKANMSVDMQIVRQMNTILQADEAVAGKPATVVQAKQILADNGCDDFTPTFEQNVYYWVGSENRVILWEKDEPISAAALMMVVSADDGAETGKVTYPNDLAKKYKDLTEPSADWSDLSVNYVAQSIAPEEGQTLEEAFIAALQAADTSENQYFALPKNATLTLSATQIGQFNAAMASAVGVGKNIHVDLNGGTINAERQNTIFNVPDGATLEFANGKMNVVSTNYNHAGFQVQTGGSLVLRDLDIDGLAYAMFFPSSTASEVIIDSCDITCDANWALMTNGMTSNAVRVVINNSTIDNTVDGGGIGLMVNCDSNVHIENTTVIGSKHALVMRAGHAEVIDCTLKTVATTAGIYKWDTFTHFSSTYYYWGTGNAVPGATLVVGDHSESPSSYPAPSLCELYNVKLESANVAEVPTLLVAARAQKVTTLTYDSASSVGTLVLYDRPHVMGNGTVTVNGTAQQFSEFVLPDIAQFLPNPRYAIPAAVGTFATYQFYDVSTLDVVVDGVNILQDFKAAMAAQGLNLTDAQWATVKIAAGSQANVIKTLEYDRNAG